MEGSELMRAWLNGEQQVPWTNVIINRKRHDILDYRNYKCCICHRQDSGVIIEKNPGSMVSFLKAPNDCFNLYCWRCYEIHVVTMDYEELHKKLIDMCLIADCSFDYFKQCIDMVRNAFGKELDSFANDIEEYGSSNPLVYLAQEKLLARTLNPWDAEYLEGIFGPYTAPKLSLKNIME